MARRRKNPPWHQRLLACIPRGPRRLLLRFEAAVSDRTAGFAQARKASDRVLDAGAGELQYAGLFRHCQYLSVDLGIGDLEWDYGGLDVVGDLGHLPFEDQSFDAVINIVVLEHTRRPAQVVQELARVLRGGGALLIVVPQEWAMHQIPHDYFRFTRSGLEMLLTEAGFCGLQIQPVGGFFSLLGRRVLESSLYFQGGWRWPLLPLVLLLCLPLGLFLPLLDFLDRDRHSTLGYICEARKRAA